MGSYIEAVSSLQCKMDSFKGKFERTSAEKYEEFLKVGEEFDETTADGREVTALVTHEGDKFIFVQKAKKDGQKSTKSIREFTADECILTMTIDGMEDLVCVQKFKRV